MLAHPAFCGLTKLTHEYLSRFHQYFRTIIYHVCSIFDGDIWFANLSISIPTTCHVIDYLLRFNGWSFLPVYSFLFVMRAVVVFMGFVENEE